MKRHIKIECSPEVRELNEAVETADLITDYHFDWTTGEQLAGVLESQGCPFHAADLRNKLAAVEKPTLSTNPWGNSGYLHDKYETINRKRLAQ